MGCPANVGRGPATREQTRDPGPRAAELGIRRLLQTRPFIPAYFGCLGFPGASVGPRTAQVISGQP